MSHGFIPGNREFVVGNKPPRGLCVVPKSKTNSKSESVVPKLGKSGEVVGNSWKSPGKSEKLKSIIDA